MTVMKGGYGNSGFPGNLAQGLVVTVNTAYDILLSGVQVLHGLKEQRALQSFLCLFIHRLGPGVLKQITAVKIFCVQCIIIKCLVVNI